MSDQEREEQAQAVNKFHDKHSYQKPPDWLSEEAKGEGEAEEPINEAHFYDLGHHTVELNQQGTTIVQVTHSDVNASYGNRIIEIRDGWMVRDTANPNLSAAEVPVS